MGANLEKIKGKHLGKAENCEICKKKFQNPIQYGIIYNEDVKTHLCRRCGRYVCIKCAPKKQKSVIIGYKDQNKHTCCKICQDERQYNDFLIQRIDLLGKQYLKFIKEKHQNFEDEKVTYPDSVQKEIEDLKIKNQNAISEDFIIFEKQYVENQQLIQNKEEIKSKSKSKSPKSQTEKNKPQLKKNNSKENKKNKQFNPQNDNQNPMQKSFTKSKFFVTQEHLALPDPEYNNDGITNNDIKYKDINNEDKINDDNNNNQDVNQQNGFEIINDLEISKIQQRIAGNNDNFQSVINTNINNFAKNYQDSSLEVLIFNYSIKEFLYLLQEKYYIKDERELYIKITATLQNLNMHVDRLNYQKYQEMNYIVAILLGFTEYEVSDAAQLYSYILNQLMPGLFKDKIQKDDTNHFDFILMQKQILSELVMDMILQNYEVILKTQQDENCENDEKLIDILDMQSFDDKQIQQIKNQKNQNLQDDIDNNKNKNRQNEDQQFQPMLRKMKSSVLIVDQITEQDVMKISNYIEKRGEQLFKSMLLNTLNIQCIHYVWAKIFKTDSNLPILQAIQAIILINWDIIIECEEYKFKNVELLILRNTSLSKLQAKMFQIEQIEQKQSIIKNKYYQNSRLQIHQQQNPSEKIEQQEQ